MFNLWSTYSKDSNNEKFDELLEDFDSNIKYGKEHSEFTIQKQDVSVSIPKNHEWLF